MRPLLWTNRSLRHLVAALAKEGHKVCPTVVGNLLRGLGYSLQANNHEHAKAASTSIATHNFDTSIRKPRRSWPQMNRSSRSIRKRRSWLAISRTMAGNGVRGPPELVNVHDFIDPKLSRAVPYGVYDITNNVGWVSVGTDHDTASFAVNAIRRWWRAMGKKRHPKATQLMISADGGGSNGSRVRLWKVELQMLADELKLPITVCHLPPGTSKWNKIEHRLFSFITINWRGRPLRSYRTIVQLIAATTTDAGLKVRAELDEKKYPKGVKVSDDQLAAVNLSCHAFHGDWNYTISPHRRTH